MLNVAIVGEAWRGAKGTNFVVAGSDWVGSVVSSLAIVAAPCEPRNRVSLLKIVFFNTF